MISYWDLFLIPTNPNFKGISSFKSIFLALVPLSIISILVITPIVLSPVGSNYLANLRPSDVAISALAGITQRIIVLSSEQYRFAISVVILKTSICPAISILVIPGKSIIVKSGQSLEYTVSLIGSSTIPREDPATLLVSSMILWQTYEKSKYLFPLSTSNTAYDFSFFLASRWTSLSSSGLLVTTPDPLGKKSKPTIFSSNELLPEDCVPKTTILGKEICLSSP